MFEKFLNTFLVRINVKTVYAKTCCRSYLEFRLQKILTAIFQNLYDGEYFIYLE